ncbi:MAG: hypothetical protein WBD00_03765 [Candidatus Omnitrophota bacterium]
MGTPEYCWEYWNCSEEEKEECPHYMMAGYRGTSCWLNDRIYTPKTGRDFKDCRECPWYKKFHL